MIKFSTFIINFSHDINHYQYLLLDRENKLWEYQYWYGDIDSTRYLSFWNRARVE